jgi:hypothetical protein
MCFTRNASLNVILLNVILLNVILLNVILPNVILLNVIPLNVLAPFMRQPRDFLDLSKHRQPNKSINRLHKKKPL